MEYTEGGGRPGNEDQEEYKTNLMAFSVVSFTASLDMSTA